jgi:tRNA pseudouridine38-40 synthase
VLAYDGASYQGFQVQGDNVPTIQGTVEAALKKASGGQDIPIIGAGRTDSGVHATGQVIAFDLAWKHDDEDLLRAVNALLPTDIAIQRLDRAEAGFHPRFDAVSRTYQYFVYEAQIRQPMMARMSWWVKPPVHTRLDVELMNWAAAKLLGSHDFGSFGNPTQGESTVRQVFQSEWTIEVPTRGTRLLSYCIEANAFLYHMVRTTVGTLVAHGLTLIDVKYDKRGESPAGESRNEI